MWGAGEAWPPTLAGTGSAGPVSDNDGAAQFSSDERSERSERVSRIHQKLLITLVNTRSIDDGSLAS